jgi:hypothetical protein
MVVGGVGRVAVVVVVGGVVVGRGGGGCVVVVVRVVWLHAGGRGDGAAGGSVVVGKGWVSFCGLWLVALDGLGRVNGLTAIQWVTGWAMPVVAGLVVVVLERDRAVADVMAAGVEVGAPATCPAFG